MKAPDIESCWCLRVSSVNPVIRWKRFPINTTATGWARNCNITSPGNIIAKRFIMTRGTMGRLINFTLFPPVPGVVGFFPALLRFLLISSWHWILLIGWLGGSTTIHSLPTPAGECCNKPLAWSVEHSTKSPLLFDPTDFIVSCRATIQCGCGCGCLKRSKWRNLYYGRDAADNLVFWCWG